MPEYKYINRSYLLTTLFFSLLCSICLIICGTVTWQTTILEEALSETKMWQRNLGLLICLLAIVGAISFESGSRGLSWLYVFCTIALALVAFVHAKTDTDEGEETFLKTQLLLKRYFKNYEHKNFTKIVINFQTRMRCCGLHDKKEMARGEQCTYIQGCCHWKVSNCTDEDVYEEPCFDKAEHVIYLLRLCAALAIITGVVQLLVLLVLFFGGIKYVYHLMFPPGGPIIDNK
ncbi:unnamed protein product [Phyllotreta striolata]|uniref:Tetraspanin n=1 Tax=Phyllotreta striolata TaxID=444603 RepID=A0A9N9TQB2_PHYSR|nr:unnamed protein product [Phyllotreta striolata]